MLLFENNNLRFIADKCCACTVCIGICKEKALSLQSLSDDKIKIKVNHTKCTKCGQCVKICPANKFQEEKLSDLYFDKALNFEIAFALDKKIRYNSSSGGCTRTIAFQALKAGLVDAVYTLDNSNESPSGTYYYSPESLNILQTVNSQYRPVNFGDKIGKDINTNKKLIIGTPCQIKAVKRFYQFKNNLNVYYIALLCKQQKNNQYLNFLKKQYGIVDKNSIFFRGSGWPGKTGDNHTQILYSAVAGIAFGKKLWTVNGCKYCGDCIGIDTADLTVADPWNLNEFQDDSGKNLIFIWSEKGKTLMETSQGLLQRTEVSQTGALKSIDWSEYKNKIKHIDYHNHHFDNFANALLFRLHCTQQNCYEKLLTRIKLSPFFIKVLNRLPYV